jgi:hypothetical protein
MLKSILISIALFLSSTMILAAQAVPQQQACPDGSEYRDGTCVHYRHVAERGWLAPAAHDHWRHSLCFPRQKDLSCLGGKSDPTSGKSW